MRLLVTGATGFIGRAILAHALLDRTLQPRGSVRHMPAKVGEVECVAVGDLSPETNWRDALEGVDAVVHTAARVHIMRETADSLVEFRRANVEGTVNLARQAAVAGVRRFVFISSIGVNGIETVGKPFTAADIADPRTPYAVSKHEAEMGLQQLAKESPLEIVSIRPPLVFGPQAPGNFGQLIRVLQSGIPLPLGAVRNRRSFVALDNLVDLVLTCLRHPNASNQTFLISDGEDISTPQLLQRIGRLLGKPARLFPMPMLLLKLGAALLGKQDMLQRLCGSLQVDMLKTQQLLGWSPPITLEDGLLKVAQAERSGRRDSNRFLDG